MKLLCWLLFPLLLLTGCDRRPLEVIVDEQVRVRIVVRWQVNFVDLYGQQPNGMTVMIWPSDGSAPIIRTTNEDNITVKLAPDTYRMIIFNELAEEYAPYVLFHDANNYDLMTARATTFTIGTRAWDDGTTYMYAPEDPRIAVATDTFDITPEMVLQDTTIFLPYEEYRNNGFINYRESEQVFEIPETPWPMTVDLFVRLKLHNRLSLKTIEGSISGLADGFSFSQVVRTTTAATLRFDPEGWERTRYSNMPEDMGVATTRLASFGLPFGKELLEQRDSIDNILRLRLTLTNDSVLDYTYKVGRDIHYLTPEGREAEIRYRQDLRNLELVIDLPDTIPLPVVIPTGGTGFDARVDDWEDGGTFDLGGF